ncbi:unnamed protein product [Didymodactylos carnosus]|uniref:Uncharacterized protein n=1 Tax=Didymodactylos carnosus TaxID=1234261 RepID=A0A815LGR9_9BILA|nr:unnamed protein product [Didymodactylos carnosus]CAF1408038.1 unnamed protein product [Didymodactylos carnosus]CAF4020710.1 unnamed protein product [Didymodactylos carnosus]CAF4298215.1 unnamed protein product [Didymodactylos carnosus]
MSADNNPVSIKKCIRLLFQDKEQQNFLSLRSLILNGLTNENVRQLLDCCQQHECLPNLQCLAILNSAGYTCFNLSYLFILCKQLPNLLHLNLNCLQLALHTYVRSPYPLKCKIKFHLIIENDYSDFRHFELLLKNMPNLYYLNIDGSSGVRFNFYRYPWNHFFYSQRWQNLLSQLTKLKQISIDITTKFCDKSNNNSNNGETLIKNINDTILPSFNNNEFFKNLHFSIELHTYHPIGFWDTRDAELMKLLDITRADQYKYYHSVRISCNYNC